jgi:hypothetical protein
MQLTSGAIVEGVVDPNYGRGEEIENESDK